MKVFLLLKMNSSGLIFLALIEMAFCSISSETISTDTLIMVDDTNLLSETVTFIRYSPASSRG